MGIESIIHSRGTRCSIEMNGRLRINFPLKQNSVNPYYSIFSKSHLHFAIKDHNIFLARDYRMGTIWVKPY